MRSGANAAVLERTKKMNKYTFHLCVVLLAALVSPKLGAQTTVCQANPVLGQNEIAKGIALDGQGHAWIAFSAGNFIGEFIQESNGSCVIGQKIPIPGSGPNGIAFDGTYLWVSNYYSNTVSKVSISSSSVVGTFTVGSGPRGVVFDGTFIWVANYLSNTVTKLQPSNGAVIGTFAVGSGPYFMAVNTANHTIWVPNLNSNTVTELNQSGRIVNTISTQGEPVFLAFDGTNMWVSSYTSETVEEFSPSGAILRVVNVSSFGSPTGLTWDSVDGRIWGVSCSRYLFSIDESTGGVTGSFLGGGNLYDIIFNGSVLYVTDIGNGVVTELNP
jgi:YVTN family beta-propeller protein